MDQIEKIPNDKITKLENEIKVLKNEVQAVLLDLRESYLNRENPFNSSANPATTQSIVITERPPMIETQTENSSRANENSEPVKTEKPQFRDSKKTKDDGSEKKLWAKQSNPENHNSEQSEEENTNLEEDSKAQHTFNPGHEPGIFNREKMVREPSPPAQLDAKPLDTAGIVNRKCVKLDLVTMAGLTGWVEQSAKKIGRERTEAVLEISEAMGCVSPELKPILIKLITLAKQNPVEEIAGTRDYMNSLIKLNSLLGDDNREEKALLLLSLVSGEPNHG
jgi:hypothetical protein